MTETPAATQQASSKSWRESVFRWVPALDSLRDYSVVSFRRDVVAGLTVAAVAVPQAMAYASIFGMPVEYGLYTAIVMTGIGALFDSSKQLINGPTNAISIAMLSALAGVSEENRISAAIFMAFLIGLIQTGITFLRLGDLSRYISHAVIVGFTLGASVLLVLDQLKNLFGLPNLGPEHYHDPFLKRFWLTMTQDAPWHWYTFGVASLTVIAALVIRWINRRFRLGIPELLAAISIAGLVVWMFGLSSTGVSLISKVPRSLPSFQKPLLDLELAREMISSAMAIAFLGLLEAIAMAKSIASKTGQKLDINQQCLSEGLANLGGSFFQCFPGSGSLTRSYINHQAGAATQWSGVFCAVFVGLTVLAFAPLAQYIPKAALAGVLMMAATRMIDLKGLMFHMKATRFDAIIVVVTALSAVMISIEFCILIGVVMSFLIYVPKAARVELTELVLTHDGVIREKSPQETSCSRMKLYNFEGELFFGSAPEFESHLERIESDITEVTYAVILRVKHLRNPDAVCMDLLDRFIDRMRARKIELALSGVRDDLYETLVRTGIVRKMGASRVFRELSTLWSSTTTAINWAYQVIDFRLCETCPRRNATYHEPDQWHFMI